MKLLKSPVAALIDDPNLSMNLFVSEPMQTNDSKANPDGQYGITFCV